MLEDNSTRWGMAYYPEQTPTRQEESGKRLLKLISLENPVFNKVEVTHESCYISCEANNKARHTTSYFRSNDK